MRARELAWLNFKDQSSDPTVWQNSPWATWSGSQVLAPSLNPSFVYQLSFVSCFFCCSLYESCLRVSPRETMQNLVGGQLQHLLN